MSVAGGRKTKGRFGYLAAASGAEEGAAGGAREAAGDEGSGSRTADGAGDGADRGSGERGGGEAAPQSARRSRRAPAKKAPTEELASVPKGEGRMKQERSQLNVRIPTTLKRRAAAKATLEGKDIGGVVEELLRGYLER
ncbi:MAG: hypothetical protein M3P49_13910 [Actinomycetota bacterium]|nr:hypothetical protein [Actinomycetota bacterium]